MAAIDPSAPALLPPGQQWLIRLVKGIHSLAFFAISASVLQVCWAGLTGRPSRWTKPAIVVAVGESAIFIAFRFRCPLRLIAEDLGTESGQVTDIYLPAWLANRVTWIFTPLLVLGLAGLDARRLVRHLASRSLPAR